MSEEEYNQVDETLEAGAPRELTEEERQKLAELDEALAKFVENKRWSDVIKTTLAKAEIVVDPEQKIALLKEAGTLYVERSSNQAEAIKCYEAVLELSPYDLEAIENLKGMYEKRRAWEPLIRVMQREAELLDPADRAIRYVEMADLATQKLRKPEICIEMWELVLSAEPGHPQAIEALAPLYERVREWEKLAGVLEVLIDGEPDLEAQKTQLQKLGMLYGDKLNDDARAVRAFKRLLQIDPDDRRAQEQLKRRYVALKAWDELEEFYEPTGKWDELIRVLEREADNAEVPDAEKIDILFRAARLWEEKNEKPDRAARSYEKILEIDPENLRAAEALTPIYEGGRDASKLANVYEVRLKHLEEPNARIAMLREVGLLYEEKLRDPATAFERYLEAFSTGPTQEIVREDVSRLAESVEGGWDRVIRVYQDAIEASIDEDESLGLRMDFGGVLKNVGRIDEAIAQFRAVYDARPEHMGAVNALSELYRMTERYGELLEIYDARMEIETDLDARRQLAYGKASLYQDALGDANAAIEAYNSILAEYGDQEADAFRALDALYEQQERWEELADTIARRVALAEDGQEEASLRFRLGKVYESRLGRKADAVELYRHVLTLLPEHDGGRESLEALLDDAEVGATAAEILEPIYELRGEHAPLIRALRVRAAGAGDAEEKLGFLSKAAQVYADELGDVESAFATFAEAFRALPSHEGALARLEMMALEHEKFPALVELLADVAGAQDDPVLARELWVKTAKIKDEQLGDVDGAVASYGKVLEIDPGDLEVLSALESLHGRAGRYRDLVNVLRMRVAQTTDPVEQEALLAQMASIHDELLEEPEEAVTLYREILSIDEASPRALSALDALFARLERWTELADNVERQLQLADDPDRQIELMIRLAELRETKMGEVASAIEIYSEVLGRDDGNERALAALERLLQSPEHEVAVAEILEPVYQTANEFEKLIGVHEIQARTASSPERRVELLHRIAELYEMGLDDANRAFEAMARALVEDASNVRTQEELDRLGQTTGDMERLAKVYEARIEGLEDPTLVASLYTKAAQIREVHLDHSEIAISHYRKVLEIDEHNLDAASSLERLFEITARYEDLAAICIKKAEMLHDAEEQKAYYYRAATIFEETLERPEDAIAVLAKVLEIDPEEFRAIDKQIELYLGLEQWEPLLRAYNHKADVVQDFEEKRRLYTEVGAVYERELKDIPRAIDTYQRILELAPDDMTAIGRLDALYQATENWQELLSVLERQADLAEDPFEVIGYRYRIAELWHRRLNDPARAVEIYGEILDVNAEHGPTLAALESMIDENVEALAAALVLEPVYRATGEAERLIRVIEVQIAAEEDPIAKVDRLHQVADLYENHLDRPAQAFEAYGRAVACDPGNEDTLSHLERLAHDVEEGWRKVATLYDEQIQARREDAPDDVLDLALRTAQIYELHLEEPEPAIERLKLVLEIDPAHVDAIRSLDRLYDATEKWPELMDILAREIDVATSADEILELQYRLGYVAQQHVGDIDRAVEAYRGILEAAPEHQNAMAALEGLFAGGVKALEIGEFLEPLYRMQEQWEKLLFLNEHLLQYQADPSERIALMHRAAEIAESRLLAADRASIWMQRALLEDPANEETLREVERLAAVNDGWAQLANTYADAIVSEIPAEDRVMLGKRLARVYEEELGDVERSEASLRYVVALAGKDQEALEALDRIYYEHGAHESLVDVIKRRVAASDDPMEQVELNYRLGQVLEDDLQRSDDAVAVYKHILESLEPEHAESIKALQEIYTRKEDWPNLLQAFEKELAVALGDVERADIYAKMARLGGEKLGDVEKAKELWREVLDVRGEDPEALAALGRIYASQENWRDLVDILEREVEAESNDDQNRVQIYLDLGKIWYGKLGREGSAIDSWRACLDIDPSNTEALFHIAEVYREKKQWPELTSVLDECAEVGAAVLDESQLEHIYLQAAYVFEHELEQSADAIAYYRKAWEVNPRSLVALAGLETIFRREMEWHDVVDVMEKRVAVLEDPQERIQQLLAIARVWEDELENADGGTSAFQRILEEDPLHDYAFRRLEALHAVAERWEDLIELYLTRVENSEDVDERVILLRKAAHVFETKLGDANEAYDLLYLAWSVDFTNTETSRELERVTRETRRFNELLTNANAALQQIEDQKIRNAISLCAARWYGQELDHPEYAIPYYQQILQSEPTNVAAMRQMGDLYRKMEEYGDLAQLLGRIVEITDDVAVQTETYVDMGDLAREHLGVPEQAPAYYQRAIELDPKCLRAILALEEIYREEGRWAAYLDILHKKVEAVTSEEARRKAKLQIAETHEDRTGDTDTAIAVYKEVVESDPNNLVALKGLERLYAKVERWTELREVLEAQLEVVNTERERISLLMRLAAMWEEEFVKPDIAAERLEQVLEINPGHVEALTGLARLYRAARKWDQLVDTYERHIDATPDKSEKIRLFKAQGGVLEANLDDLHRAIDAYLAVIDLDAEDVEALDALSKLYIKTEDYSAALDVLERLAPLVEAPADRVRLEARIGSLLEEHIGDRALAIDHYQKALDIDPKHLPSLEALRAIYLDSGDWLDAARVLRQEVESNDSARVKAARLVELGHVFDQRLDEHEQAVEVWEEALKHDPDCEEAALPLVDEYVGKEQWGEAYPLLDLLVKTSDKREKEEQHRLAELLGRAAMKVGEIEEAIKAYTKAHQLDPQHLPSLVGLANALFAAEDWDKAFKHYQMLLVQHRDALDRDLLVDVFYRQGMVKRAQNEPRKAINMFDKALEEDAAHRPTLDALVDIYAEQGKWDRVIHFKQQTLDNVLDDEERFTLLIEIGDIYSDKLKNPEEAIQPYSDACDIRPDDHAALHKLLAAFQRTKRWPDVVDTIERISALDDRPQAKSKYAYTIAVITRDEIGDPDGAMERFNQALDLDPSQLKAFEAINKILTERKDWKNLERAYRKMLHRIIGKGNAELEFNLWHTLGIIYRDRQKNFELAAEAFRQALTLQPENELVHQILSEIYSRLPDRVNEAIEEHQWLLQHDPYRVDSYRALYRLYFEARAYDKAWCVASTLVFLQKADKEHQQFFEQYRPKDGIRPRNRLDEERWVKDLRHADENVYVSKIMEILGVAVFKAQAKPDKVLGINKLRWENPHDPQGPFSQAFHFVHNVLGVQTPVRLCVDPHRPGGMEPIPHAEQPSILAGGAVATGLTPDEAKFAAAKQLTYYRSEHIIRTMINSHSELKTLLMGALHMGGVNTGDQTAAATAAQLQRLLEPIQIDALRALVRKFVESGGSADIKAWMRGVEYTACQAGFVVTHDLAVAGKMVPQLPSGGSVDAPPKDKLRELLLFSVSERYFRIRQALGVEIQV